MKILVTGSAGRIGRHVIKALQEAGHTPRSFDMHASRDEAHIPGSVLEPSRVREAVQGCDAVIHLAAIPNDMRNRESEIFTTNVQGTWNVLQAAAEAEVQRVVAFSSIQVFGLTATPRKPDYLPLDDDHPHYPIRTYSLTKNMVESLCRYYTDSAGISTICLRPTYVSDADSYARWNGPTIMPTPYWRQYATSDLWSYVDVEDVAQAAVLSIAAKDVRHETLLLAADDTRSKTPTAELIAEHYAGIPLRFPENAFADNPFRGLIDTSRAAKVLGWRPRHFWRDRVADKE